MALKRPRQGFKKEAKILAMENFKEEAKILRQLRDTPGSDDAHIIKFHGVWVTQDKSGPYLVMEYGEHDLNEMIRYRNIDLKQKLTWAIHVAKALAFLFQHSIVHFDVKPKNVVICGPENKRIAKLVRIAHCIGLCRAH